MQATPATWQLLLASGWQGRSGLKILCGGEAWNTALARQLTARARSVWNMYGPTETTVWSTIHRVDADGGAADAEGTVPIGRPIANTRIYILDGAMQPAPVGDTGDLYIGGAGVARGYWRRAELTQTRFVPDPFGDGSAARLYRTGDLARYRADGTIEFLGRADDQIKLRGYRIELGEIEAALAQHPAVRQVAVAVRTTAAGDDQLVAYIVWKTDAGATDGSAAASAAELRRHLKAILPDYMVPAAYVTLDTFPLTPNGKVDRRALPAPQGRRQDADAGAPYDPPATPAEQLLATIWSEALGIDRVGRADNFFDLGGHSLLAMRVVWTLLTAHGIDLPIRLIYAAPQLADLAREVESRRPEGEGAALRELSPKVEPRPEDRYLPFPLTGVQQAYWLGRSASFELGRISCQFYREYDASELDVPRLARAWQRLVERHDMLRAIVRPDGQQQILKDVPPYEIELLDLAGRAQEARESALHDIRERMSHQVLEAAQWPLFELRASRIDTQHIRLHIAYDILITDALSMDILMSELGALYRNPDAVLPAPRHTFRDYVLAYDRIHESELWRRSRDYWMRQVDDFPQPPDLPLAKDPASIAVPYFTRREFLLERASWMRLRSMAASANMTPTVVLMAVMADVLRCWSGRDTFALNLTLFNRLPLCEDVDRIVGDFTALSLLRVGNAHLDTFEDRVRWIQEQLWSDLDHRYFTGVDLLRELRMRRDDRSGALMPVVFTSIVTDQGGGGEPAASWLGRQVYGIAQTPQVWIDLIIEEAPDGISFGLMAVDELFPDGLLDDLFDCYCRMLVELATNAQRWKEPRHAMLEWLLPQRQRELLAAANATSAPLPEGLLHSRFHAQAARRGDQPAVIVAERAVSYAQLEAVANRAARELRALGARPNTMVGVVMGKGWEQVAAVLGILQAGAAYVPIDPRLPAERLHALLAMADVKVALTQGRFEQTLPWPQGVERVVLGPQWLEQPSPGPPLEPLQRSEDLAYVIYTSGSTGTPKGVMIDHCGALNTVLDVNERFGIGASDRVFALSSLSFDLSVYDIFGTLAAGGTIVMPDPDDERDPSRWAAMAVEHGVTVWNTVPALLQLLVDYAEQQPACRPLPLRLAMMSGDWIPITLPDRVRAVAPGAAVISLGGATEASIWSILYPIGTVDPTWASIPYGKPMRNQRFHVLNRALEPCPVWVPGDLYIGGIGLAKGYWRDEAKTQASFITHPHTGERLYRTGDRGRYLPDGNIEFMGREDFQVKIQGFRVELGEIEAALLGHPGIRAAAVAAVGERQDAKRLVGYVVGEGAVPATEDLQAFLAAKLPAYMVPATFVTLPAMPLTANGKVDRRALPAPTAPVAQMPVQSRRARGDADRHDRRTRRGRDGRRTRRTRCRSARTRCHLARHDPHREPAGCRPGVPAPDQCLLSSTHDSRTGRAASARSEASGADAATKGATGSERGRARCRDVRDGARPGGTPGIPRRRTGPAEPRFLTFPDSAGDVRTGAFPPPSVRPAPQPSPLRVRPGGTRGIRRSSFLSAPAPDGRGTEVPLRLRGWLVSGPDVRVCQARPRRRPRRGCLLLSPGPACARQAVGRSDRPRPVRRPDECANIRKRCLCALFCRAARRDRAHVRQRTVSSTP